MPSACFTTTLAVRIPERVPSRDREDEGRLVRTPVRLMARPPQYAYPENDSFAVAKAKELLKGLSPEGRAYVMAWLVKFYNDAGGMFSPGHPRAPQGCDRRRGVLAGEDSHKITQLAHKLLADPKLAWRPLFRDAFQDK